MLFFFLCVAKGLDVKSSNQGMSSTEKNSSHIEVILRLIFASHMKLDHGKCALNHLVHTLRPKGFVSRDQ